MMKKWLDMLDKGLSAFEDWSIFIAVMVALLALFINVVLRYGFNYSLAWSEELVREVIIYTTLIGCSAAIRKRAMIKIDASVQLFPRLKFPLTMFSHAVTIAFSILIFVYGWRMALMQYHTHQKTIILQIPLVYIFAILPLMGILVFIRTLQVASDDVFGHLHYKAKIQ